MNPQLKEILLNLLQMLLALAQTPKANEEEASKIQEMVTDHLAWVKTAHGDCELADPEIQDKLNDLSVVLGSSEPDPEHAEVPEFDEDEETPTETETETETEETTEDEATEEAEPEPEPTPAPKKILTIKEKREATERAAQAAKAKAPAAPAPKTGLKKKK